MDESSYATYPSQPPPPPTFASVAASGTSNADNTADFDAMRRQFEAASISSSSNAAGQPQQASSSSATPAVSNEHHNNKGKRYPSSSSSSAAPAAPSNSIPLPQQQIHQPTGIIPTPYADVYAAAAAANYAAAAQAAASSFAAGAAPFIPGAPHQSYSQVAGGGGGGGGAFNLNGATPYSGSTSPYLGVGMASPNPPSQALPYGSPSSQSNGALPNFPGSNGAGPGGPPSMTGYETMPSSPNPYSNPYAFGFPGMPGTPQANAAAFMGMFGPPAGGGGQPHHGQQQQQQQPGSGAASPSLSTIGLAGMGMGAIGMGAMGMMGMGGGLMGSPNPAFGQLPFGTFGGIPIMSGPRTVYVGNLPSDASVDELLSQVRFGPIDSVKILPEKSCAFISFLDPHTASAFHSDAVMRKVRLHDQDLKIGWGKPSAVPPAIILAVNQTGATRNVYLGNLDEDFTEQSLRDELSRFGPIDQVKIVRDKNIGFVHFLSIATAIKVVQTLASEPEWAGRRVNYGKDRCAYVPKNQHQQQQHNMAAAAMGSIAAAQFGGFGGFGQVNGMGENSVNGSPDPNAQPGNRTIYLGNIHPDTTIEDICNSIRGGILQQIRYIPEKHICFVTFVDPACALAFYQSATFQGIALHNRRLKIGWGKSSGPTSPGIAMVVQSGGSRNVYIGNIEDFETYTEAKLREDFGEYGDLELVNLLPAKNCAFCNFTNIANAIKAIEGMKSNKDYQNLKISFGKDRCGGAPRQMGRNNNFDYPRGQSHQNSHNNFGTGSPFPDGGYPDGIGLIEFSDDFAEGPGAGALVLDESVAQEEQHNKSF